MPVTLPLTIIGGYLGAGKTTLVNHLLRHADGLRLAVLVNEFGELPIDQDLIEAQDDNIISIAGGCVCCSYGNDLTLALMDMSNLDPQPDHVLLEASGVAIPGAIGASIGLLAGYALDAVVVLVNADTVREQANDTYIGDTITRQLDDADLLILNKVDLVSSADRESTAVWLQERSACAEIVQASQGVLPPKVVLQSYLSADRLLSEQPSHDSAQYKTLSLSVDGTVDAEALAQGLAEISPGLLRAKGFVSTPNDEMKTIQLVGRRTSITPAPPGVGTNLVVIGHAARFNEQAVRELLGQVRIGHNIND